jgi:diphthamide biosynthesis protein 3
MIPPCDPSILEHNPQFKRLYENLTTSFLNPDASTRAQATNLARTAVEVSRRIPDTRSSSKRS